ncbi:MAG: hypothetical protein IJE07_09580 [Clostridia bacterium]|nr:hypothetical protein [Clostridia bacterium]
MRILRPLLLLLVMVLLAAPALAEDVCVVKNAATASSLSTDCSYLRVRCPLDGSVPVTLTIRDSWGYLLYQRDYGLCSGEFCSEDVYLRLDGSSVTYTVSLSCGSDAYQFRVTRTAPRLTDTGVTANGMPLSEITGRRDNKAAVLMDVYALEGSTLTVPLTSNGMQLGYANLTVEDGQLTVSAVLTVDGTIEKATVYVARDAVTAATLGTNRFTGTKAKLNRAIDLHGSPYAAVVVQLTVSYDETTAQPFQEDSHFLKEQRELWEMMMLTTANEAVG